MRISITCAECGRRHRLARSVHEIGPIWIVCNGCELPLRTESLGSLVGRRVRRRPVAGGTRRPIWAGYFDHQGVEKAG